MGHFIDSRKDKIPRPIKPGKNIPQTQPAAAGKNCSAASYLEPYFDGMINDATSAILSRFITPKMKSPFNEDLSGDFKLKF